jgi:hypothetical protein
MEPLVHLEGMDKYCEVWATCHFDDDGQIRNAPVVNFGVVTLWPTSLHDSYVIHDE